MPRHEAMALNPTPGDADGAVRRTALYLGLAGLLAAAAAVAYVMTGPPRAAPAGLPAAVMGVALDAEAAGHGDPEALERLRAESELLVTPQRLPDAESLLLKRMVAGAAVVLHARVPLADTGSAAETARGLVPKLLGEGRSLGQSFEGRAADAVQRPLERFEALAERIEIDLEALTRDASTVPQAGQRLAEATDFLGLFVRGLQGSDTGLGMPRAQAASLPHLEALSALYGELAASVRRAVSAAPALPAAQAAARDLSRDARALAASRALAALDAPPRPWWPLLLGIAALVPLALALVQLAGIRREAARQRAAAELQRDEGDRNQQAILRLLDELSSLADGDLTVQATVTEDITGAIADSINYAVDALRGLVTTINQSAIQVDGAARQTQALAQHLAKASAAQSKQIASATESIGAMAGSTEEVSGNAERASDVARHSVDVAHKGGEAVRRTIDGMNTIRETIQETSKRIKRLGESSQEIGNIVELINDIAEQTNILALNASIQASMAGEAGRGFAVVADEVQRLAERAANATKQIEVLVRTIQTDTNEAVVSMERSTTDVVGGALLAENAGAALEEIEQVSNQIASLVQNISGSSRQQAQGAQNIARNMQVLKEISSQTADSTSATSQAIAKLAELSAGLRQSAAGFRLPAPQPGTRAGSSGTFRQVRVLGGS
jgi:twitching motility protein PilJ